MDVSTMALELIDKYAEVIVPVALTIVLYYVGLLYYIVQRERTIISNTITVHRIEWIKEVRGLLAEFVCAYEDGKPSSELRKIKAKIELYCRKREDGYPSEYKEMVDELETCCKDEKYNAEHCQNVIDAAQVVLGCAWARVKVEGGMTKKKNDKIGKKVRAYGIFGPKENAESQEETAQNAGQPPNENKQ